MGESKNIIGNIEAPALIVVKILSLFGVLFAPQIIPAAQLGQFALVFTSSLLISNLLNAGVSNQIKAGFTNLRLQWSYKIFSVMLLATIIGFLFDETLILLFYLGLISAISVQMIFEALYIKRGYIKGRVLLSITYELCPIIISIITYKVFSVDYFFSRTLIMILSLLILIFFIQYKRIKIFNGLEKNPLNTNLHFAVHSMALIVLVNAPKILEYITTNSFENLGYFQASFSLGMLPFFVLTVLDSIYQSYVLSDKESFIWNVVYTKVMPFCLLIGTILIQLLAPFILPSDYINLQLIGAVGASSIVAFWYSLFVLQEIKRNDKRKLFTLGWISIINVIAIVVIAMYVRELIIYIPLLGYFLFTIVRIKEFRILNLSIIYPSLSLIFILIILL